MNDLIAISFKYKFPAEVHQLSPIQSDKIVEKIRSLNHELEAVNDPVYLYDRISV
jgi:hypothetical protein